MRHQTQREAAAAALLPRALVRGAVFGTCVTVMNYVFGWGQNSDDPVSLAVSGVLSGFVYALVTLLFECSRFR